MYTFLMRFNDGRTYTMGEFESISEFKSYQRHDMIDLIYDALGHRYVFASANFVRIGAQTEDAKELSFPGWPKREKPELTDGLMGNLEGFNI